MPTYSIAEKLTVNIAKNWKSQDCLSVEDRSPVNIPVITYHLTH